jgi:hypothetical protein
MSWLPLLRFGSRAACVAVSALVESEGRECHTQYPLGVGQTHISEAVNGRIVRAGQRVYAV